MDLGHELQVTVKWMLKVALRALIALGVIFLLMVAFNIVVYVMAIWSMAGAP